MPQAALEAAADAMETAVDGPADAPQSDEDGLRRRLDDSRFDDN